MKQKKQYTKESKQETGRRRSAPGHRSLARLAQILPHLGAGS
jgi:hypothetical protein